MAIAGSIIWLANMTYPELSFPASQLARFISNPGKPHFDASIRVLIYLDGVRDRELVYRPNLELGFHVLVDSSWGTKFSCSGAFFFYMGCHFHWFAKMQKSVTLSSAEAEYFGAMLAAKDTVFIRDILVYLGLLKTGPTVIFADSKSAVDMAFDPVAFKNTKHILRRRRRREAESECWRQRDGYMIVTNMLEVEANRMGREGVHEANNG